MADSPAKADGGSERRPAGYKSWKKKYRKMRIVFDHKMHECEELHKQEAKAANTVKRLAIENEYVQFLLSIIITRWDSELTSHSLLAAGYWIFYSKSTIRRRSPQTDG